MVDKGSSSAYHNDSSNRTEGRLMWLCSINGHDHISAAHLFFSTDKETGGLMPYVAEKLL